MTYEVILRLRRTWLCILGLSTHSMWSLQCTLFASLEMAVRTKINDKKTPFKHLIDKVFNNRKLDNGLGPPIELSVALSRMRNDLAHGSTTMHGQGITVLQLCAELINELFV